MKHVFHTTALQLSLSTINPLRFLKANLEIKYSVLNRSLLFFFLLLMLNSCSDSRSEEYKTIDTNSPFDFHTIELFDGILYATGGDVWNKSNIATSADGSSWTLDSLTNKSIFDLYTDGSLLFGVGNDGYIFSGQPNLQLSRTKHWGLLRAFTSSKNGFIAAGGKDFNKGWIYKVNSELTIDTTHQFAHEILTTACTESGRCIAAGYGVILLSDDEGVSWQRSSENGDYYNSIAVNDRQEIFIVGYNGTIIKSSDNGDSWQKIKNGHSPLANNKPFRVIKFKNSNGVIVGDNGLIWITKDRGENWKDISIATDLDLFDFTFFQTGIVCVSEVGKIFIVTIE